MLVGELLTHSVRKHSGGHPLTGQRIGAAYLISCEGSDYGRHDTDCRHRNHQAHYGFVLTGHVCGSPGCKAGALSACAVTLLRLWPPLPVGP
jgi:hypothetical protein